MFRSCGSDLLSQRGERRQRRARGTSSERTSLAPFPQNRNTAKTPYRSVAPPLQIETLRFDLRRTFRRNLPAATKGSCAVFRRIRTRLRPIGSPAGVYGGTMDERRGTRDEGREAWTGVTDCHSRCARRLRNHHVYTPHDERNSFAPIVGCGSLSEGAGAKRLRESAVDKRQLSLEAAARNNSDSFRHRLAAMPPPSRREAFHDNDGAGRLDA